MARRGPFDFNADGKMNAHERAAEFMFLSNQTKNENTSEEKKVPSPVTKAPSGRSALGTIIRCALAIAFCIGGIVLPIKNDAGALGTALSMICGALLGAAVVTDF